MRLLKDIFLLIAAATYCLLVNSSASEDAAGLSQLDIDANTSELLLQSEKHEFQAEVNKLMKLIINSLYKNKDIFMRELISNSVDALEKIRFVSLTNSSALENRSELRIRIQPDAENNMLHIEDSGVGMTKEQLVNNLGTIARSGTGEFMQAMSSGDAQNLIGQFGVGFYSAFLVADRVVVTSKNNDDDQYIWESDASSYKIVKDTRENAKLGAGTRISLHLKEEAKEFLKPETIEKLIKKYSSFMKFPIYLYKPKVVDVEVPDEDNTKTEESNIDADGDQDAKVETESEPKMKKVSQTVWEYEMMNSLEPIWQRDPSEITATEYNEFYKQVFKDYSDAEKYVHFKGEGEISFKSLVFLPKQPDDILMREYGRHFANFKLFVRRVFITEDMGPKFFPSYLSFIKGIIDSDDMPLNVSRENLQQSKVLKVISKKVVRKCLDMIKSLAENAEEYVQFWEKYGFFMKMGVVEDPNNQNRLLPLLRFRSSYSDQLTSLNSYIDRMKPDQSGIFYLSGADMAEVQSSSLAEGILRKGYEVLYFIDAVDEYVIQKVPDFKKKKFINVAKEDIKFGKNSKKRKQMKEQMAKEFEPLLKFLADKLSSDISKAVVSDRLSESPCAVVASSYGLSGSMQRIYKSQAASGSYGDFYKNQKEILEINPRHPVIKKLLEQVVNDIDVETAADMSQMLYQVARVRSGYEIKDIVAFNAIADRVTRRSLAIDVLEPVEQDDDDDDDNDEEEDNSDNSGDRDHEDAHDHDSHDHDHAHDHAHDYDHDHDHDHGSDNDHHSEDQESSHDSQDL